MSVRFRWMCPRFVGLLASGLLLWMLASPGVTRAQSLEELQEIIKKQQTQIEAQARTLEKLQKQVEALSEQTIKAAAVKRSPDEVPPEFIRAKGGDKVSVQLYGQVNRAVMVADDGDSSDYYFVDNDSSSSRIGLLGEAKVNDDLTIGTRLEFEYQSNPSNVVNQDDKNPDGTSFDDRWIDAQLTSKRFGKIYLGKGDTASNNTSEVDLSGTAVVGYSDIGIMGGGILFFDKDADARSDTNIGGSFANFDGLSRRNRIRYDTPEFWGFTLSGSLLSDGGDVALNYAAKWGEDWTFAAAVAYANAQAVSDTIEDQYNGSASLLHSSGLNFTVAGGLREMEDSSRDEPTFYYGKVGYRAKFFEAGETRFAVDCMYTEDQEQDGDEGTAVGFQVVQDLPAWGSEYYLGYRWHELDRDNVDFDDINILMTGVRVKF